MLEYLEKLVEDKEYQKALDYAEQLLLNPENTPRDLMVIYSVLCHARCEVDEFYGGQVAGELAVRMSQELEEWDYYGYAAIWLGVAYATLRQPENAIATWFGYLSQIENYHRARNHHALILYNIGVVQGRIGKHQESLKTLQQAADVANSYGDHRKAHGIRHALIDAHLQYGQIEQIPPLLAKCAHYLRHNPTTPLHKQSLLWHLILRVRYALSTKRLARALRVVNRGLQLAAGWPYETYELRMLLARIREQNGEIRLALEDVVQARSLAVESRRYDLEFYAANQLYRLLSSYPDLVEHYGHYDKGVHDPPIQA